MFPNVSALVRVIITLPMTSCTVERLFTMTDQIKTRLRVSKSTPHLNNFTLMTSEQELTDSLDYDIISSVIMIIVIFSSPER